MSREFSTALRPLLVARQGCRKLSRVPRASCFRIRHRFIPIPPRAQLPPSTFLPLSPESGSLSSRRRPPASSSSSSTERKLWQRPSELGIDNHGDGAVFPSDFHLLSSPPLVCTQTSPTYRLSPRSLFPPKCGLWQREYARDHLRRNNDGRFYLDEYQLTRKSSGKHRRFCPRSFEIE